MENLRNPMISRAAALDAAERLQKLATMLDDDAVLNRILSEANKTIGQNAHITAAPDEIDTFGRTGMSKRLLS